MGRRHTHLRRHAHDARDVQMTQVADTANRPHHRHGPMPSGSPCSGPVATIHSPGPQLATGITGSPRIPHASMARALPGREGGRRILALKCPPY